VRTQENTPNTHLNKKPSQVKSCYLFIKENEKCYNGWKTSSVCGE